MKVLSLASIALAAVLFSCCGAALGASCTTTECHAPIAALKYPHSPVKDGDCSSCHTQKGKEHPIKGGKSFELAAKGAALCKDCHDVVGQKKLVHAPVKEGDCASCHHPHGASKRFLLEVGDDRSTLCFNCHDSAPFKAKFMHGPAAVGSCNFCHDPHSASENRLMKDKTRNLCLGCHADFATQLKQATFVHPPVSKDPCTACHDPHGSAVEMFLKVKSPDLCVGCHAKIGKQIAQVKVPHKPILEKGGCSNCHSAHFSKAKKLLSGSEMEVCLSCHVKGKAGNLRDIQVEIKDKKYLHGPLRNGSCSACHDPHGSDNTRLLRGKYPEDLYAPYQDGLYDACLKCHDRNLLRFPETTIYTKFRDGNRNLHIVHVKIRKGRTCRVCHEPHASDGEKLINKDGARFGDWKIPINFVVNGTGGSCAPGCHKPFRYDRQSPVKYN